MKRYAYKKYKKVKNMFICKSTKKYLKKQEDCLISIAAPRGYDEHLKI